jgi:hypothetical protein
MLLSDFAGHTPALLLSDFTGHTPPPVAAPAKGQSELMIIQWLFPAENGTGNMAF